MLVYSILPSVPVLSFLLSSCNHNPIRVGHISSTSIQEERDQRPASSQQQREIVYYIVNKSDNTNSSSTWGRFEKIEVMLLFLGLDCTVLLSIRPLKMPLFSKACASLYQQGLYLLVLPGRQKPQQSHGSRLFRLQTYGGGSRLQQGNSRKGKRAT